MSATFFHILLRSEVVGSKTTALKSLPVPLMETKLNRILVLLNLTGKLYIQIDYLQLLF